MTYINIEDEVTKNETEMVSIFEDPNHINLICECFFYERIICLIISVNFKFIELEQHQLTWICETLRRILMIRSLMLEIIIED